LAERQHLSSLEAIVRILWWEHCKYMLPGRTTQLIRATPRLLPLTTRNTLFYSTGVKEFCTNLNTGAL